MARRRLAVFVGGGIGTGARAAVAQWLAGSLWATFGVNVAGAYLLGFVVARLRLSARSRTTLIPFIGIGLLGAFTTFSTFAVQLVENSLWLAFAYGAGSLAAGVLAAWLGLRQGRRR